MKVSTGKLSALGYDYNLQEYLRNIMQMGSYCGDLALSELADALNFFMLFLHF